MSFYQSGGSTDERLHRHSEDQSSAAEFDARPQQQQVDALDLSTQVGERPQHQFDDRSRDDDGRQDECDHHHPSDTLASASWRQHESDRNCEADYHSSNTQFRAVQQRPFADLHTSSQFYDRSQLRQLENQNAAAQLTSGWPAPGNNATEQPAVRLPSFIYREPLPPYVPDESSPEQYHGKVVPPERLGSYLQPRPAANPTAHVYRQFASQQDLNRTVPVYPQAIGQRALDRTGPVYPQVISIFAPKPPPPPPSYLGWSIVSMLICCLPLGIAALVYSSGVATEYAAGRYDKARSKSTDARSLNIASTVAGLLTLVAVGAYNGITIANARTAG